MAGILAHSPAHVMKRLIEETQDEPIAVAVSACKGWPVFVSRLPDAPDNCIAVYDTAGLHQVRTFPDAETQEWLGVQIRIRAVDYPLGYMKACGVGVALDQLVYNHTTHIGDSEYFVPLVRRLGTIIQFPTHRATGNVLAVPKAERADRRLNFVINALMLVSQPNAEYNLPAQDDIDDNLANELVVTSGGIIGGSIIGPGTTIEGVEPAPATHYALRFPGSTSTYVDMGDTSAFEQPKGFSIAVTLKRSLIAPTTEYLVDKSGAVSLTFTKDSEGKVQTLDLSITDGTNTITASVKHVPGYAEILPVDEWHTVVATYNNDGLGSGCCIYLDGNKANNKIGGPLKIGAVLNTATHLRVGWGFYGLIEDVSVWSIELSALAASTYAQDHNFDV